MTLDRYPGLFACLKHDSVLHPPESRGPERREVYDREVLLRKADRCRDWLRRNSVEVPNGACPTNAVLPITVTNAVPSTHVRVRAPDFEEDDPDESVGSVILAVGLFVFLYVVLVAALLTHVDR